MSLRQMVPARAERARGMSLIEVTIVMAVIGMMAAIGLPSMQQWLDRYQVRTAASEIAAAMQLQRMRAVSQNRDYSIAFNANGGTYTLYDGNPTTGTMVEQQPRALATAVLFGGGSGGDSIQAPGDELIFHSDGTVNGGDAAVDQIFIASAAGDVFAVRVNRATGRVEVEHQSYGY